MKYLFFLLFILLWPSVEAQERTYDANGYQTQAEANLQARKLARQARGTSSPPPVRTTGYIHPSIRDYQNPDLTQGAVITREIRLETYRTPYGTTVTKGYTGDHHIEIETEDP